jgi:hypothetical protein
MAPSGALGQLRRLLNVPNPRRILRAWVIELPQMPTPPPKRPLGSEERRALLLLAGIPFGATDAAISANGFTRQMLAGLIRAGLATAEREKAGGQLVGRVRITEAGRRALEGH